VQVVPSRELLRRQGDSPHLIYVLDGGGSPLQSLLASLRAVLWQRRSAEDIHTVVVPRLVLGIRGLVDPTCSVY